MEIGNGEEFVTDNYFKLGALDKKIVDLCYVTNPVTVKFRRVCSRIQKGIECQSDFESM